MPAMEPGLGGCFSHSYRLIWEGVQTGHAIRMKTGSAAIAIVSISQLLNPGLYIVYPLFPEFFTQTVI